MAECEPYRATCHWGQKSPAPGCV